MKPDGYKKKIEALKRSIHRLNKRERKIEMAELIEDNMSKLKPEIVVDKVEIKNLLNGISRCTERLGRFIELRAPMFLVEREAAMIQYRALSVLSAYEAFALLDFESPK